MHHRIIAQRGACAKPRERATTLRISRDLASDLCFVVATAVAGVANIFLAAIGGTKTTFAIYLAMAIFVAHSSFALYLGGIVLFMSWLWWLTAITLGIGFQAAWKADRLRKTR